MGFCPDSPGKKSWRFSSLGRTSRTALFASREHASTRRQAVRASPLRRSTRRRAPPCLPPFRALRTSTRAPAPRRARALLPPRFKRVVARYGPAYPAAAARRALAEHPRQGTPHRGELTRSIEAADNRARDRLSDDPDAVYGVWKCLRTVRVAAISKTRARYVNARTTTDGAPPASRPAGTRPQAVVVHAEPRSDPPTRAAAPAAVQEVRDTTPARPTRAPPSPARTHSDQRAGRLASPRPPSSATGLTSSRTTARQTAATSSSSSASCTSPSPSTSWTPRDADRSRCVRRFSSTLARGVSSSKFSRQGAFSRARAFRVSRFEK